MERGIFLWSDGGNQWHLRATAGGGSARYVGNLIASLPFSAATPVDFETQDVLDKPSGRRVDFDLQMWGKAQDGIDFAVPPEADVCFTVQTPGTSVWYGAERKAVGSSISLTTLGPCGSSAAGQPAYNAGTEAGVFLWQTADGGWRMRTAAGGNHAQFSGTIAADRPFSGVKPYSWEGHDRLDSSNPASITFTSKVWSNGEDGIDFIRAAGAKSCIDLGTADAKVTVGGSRIRTASPFNLETLGACGRDGETTKPNGAPIAEAGSDQTVVTGGVVRLNAGGSSDPDGDRITYSWTIASKPTGSKAAISDPEAEQPQFTADMGGRYVVQLTASDGIATASDSVTVTAENPNTAPSAEAGLDRTVETGKVFTLDGTGSTDADGDTLTYAWQLVSKPTVSKALFAGVTTAMPAFTPDVDGGYVFSLVVSDGKAISAADQVTITAFTPNTPPVANAGSDATVAIGTAVTLDGTASTDANGDTLTYAWQLVSTPPASKALLADAAMSKPTFTPDVDGGYLFSLVVSDGKASSTADQVTITAFTPNTPPVAEAGSDRTVETGGVVTLDGSGSSDADGDTLNYTWQLVSKPAGSGALLSGVATAQPTFTPDADGSYVFSLVVSDGTDSSAADPVTITAFTPNTPPVAEAGSDATVETGKVVTLDGRGSSDADGDVLTYAWQLVAKPTGSGALLSGAATAQPTFTPDLAGSYQFSLAVSDGSDDSAADSVTVTAYKPNSIPVADAGSDRSVGVGALVTADGSGSRDVDGDSLSYSWSVASQPSGAALFLSGVNTPTPTFTPTVAGDYVLRLVVNDGKADSSPDSVTFTATAAAPPTPPPTPIGDAPVFAPTELGFADNFDNAVLTNSDTVKGIWRAEAGPNVTVKEANGALTLTSAGSHNESGLLTTGLNYKHNFFVQPLRFTVNGLTLTGTAPNLHEKLARLAVVSEPMGHYEASDAVTLTVRANGRLTFGWKSDMPNTAADLANNLVDQVLPAVPRDIELLLDHGSYRLTVSWAGGSRTFAGSHTIPQAQWGVRGDSALQVEVQRTRSVLDGTTAVLTVDKLAVDSLQVMDQFRNDSVADSGFRTGFWQTTGGADLDEAGGELQIRSGGLVSPTAKELNFFAQAIRFSGELVPNAALARFGLTGSAESIWSAEDALAIELTSDRRVTFGVKTNLRNTAPKSSRQLVNQVLTFAASRFDLKLDRVNYDLVLYGDGVNVRYTGQHGIKWYDWGSYGDSALALEGQASGSAAARWQSVLADRQTPSWVAATVYGPVGDGVNLQLPDLGELQPMLAKGAIDVTRAPFYADPTGMQDATEAVQHAVDFARRHHLVTYFPQGTYVVSETIDCDQLAYFRTNGNNEQLTEREGACIFKGAKGSKRPQLKLAAYAPGFGNVAAPKPVVNVWARSYLKGPEVSMPNASFNHVFQDLDIVVGEGNNGAIGIYFHAAQGSTMQDVTIDATHGFAGIQGGVGAGGSDVNVTVIGGQYGLYYTSSEPVPTVVGLTLIGQTRNAILYRGHQTLMAVGTKIVVPAGAGPAIKSEGRITQLGQVSLVDSEITFDVADSRNVAVKSDSSVYLYNVYVRNAGRVSETVDGGYLAGNPQGWLRVDEYAHGVRPPLHYLDGQWQYETPVYVDGVRKLAEVVQVKSGVTPPSDLQSRHVWDKAFPTWDSAGVVNVKEAPYNAKGDGRSDDTDAIQQAIDANDVVYLPKGYYRITRTLQLRRNTKLIGMAPSLSILVGSDIKGSFANMSVPQPVVRTVDDATATTAVAFLAIHAPVDLKGVYALEWRAGRGSMYRSVNLTRRSAYGWGWQPGKPGETAATHPLALVTGNGGGRWYNFHQGTHFAMRPSYRHLLVSGTREPLRIYQLNPEHAQTDAGAEIRNAHNVDIYGLKAEGNYAEIWIRDSDRVNVFGFGGNAAAFEYFTPYPAGFTQVTPSLFRVERTPNFRIVQAVDEPRVTGGHPVFGRGVRPDQWHMILERTASGATILSDVLDRPVLYKRGFVGVSSETAVEAPATGSLACGAPSYDAASESALFIWKDCQTGSWNVRATAGGFADGKNYVGSVVASQAFSGVAPYSFESQDRLDSGVWGRIDFDMTMWSPAEDGFTFSVSDPASACFAVSSATGVTVYAGPTRIRVTPPFSLDLRTCAQ